MADVLLWSRIMELRSRVVGKVRLVERRTHWQGARLADDDMGGV
jgi:hypothetical protein